MTEPTVAAAEPTGNAAAPVIDPAAAAPAAAVDTPTPEPVAYSLALPENTKLDPKVVERVTELAKANNLTPDAAQAVLARMHEEANDVLKVVEAANQKGGTIYEARVKAWAQDALAAYDLGNGNPDRLNAVVGEAQLELAKAPPAIKEFLENSGFGSHPDAIRWLRDIHARTKEKPIVTGDKGAPPTKERSMAQRMYDTEASASPT